MKTNHRLGQTGAGERALRRAHARQLLLTLAGICRQLRTKRLSPIVSTAYREVEKDLRGLARKKP